MLFRSTSVRIVSGGNTEAIIVGTSWYGTDAYIADGTTMTIYGDLTGFDCSRNGANLIALDVWNNTQLEMLYCKNNSINSLDVSQNTQLKGLYCTNNNINSLDVSENTQLIGLDCSENLLFFLDVSNNTQLTGLYCTNNDLSSHRKIGRASCRERV